MSRVSIVTAAYNPGEHLRATVDSVKAQTFTDWMWHIVDDGSKEDLSWVIDADKRIIYERIENRGPAGARNRGIEQSAGELIAFVDADDVWAPHKLARQVAVFDSKVETGLVYTQFDRIDGAGGLLAEGFATPIEGFEDLLTGCMMLTSSVMLRRSGLAGVSLFDERFRGPEDWDFFLRYLRSNQCVFLPEVLVHYRQTAGSLCRQTDSMYQQSKKVVHEHLRWARQNHRGLAAIKALEGERILRTKYAGFRFDIARESYRQRAYRDAVQGVIIVAREAPWFVVKSLMAHLSVGFSRKQKAE